MIKKVYQLADIHIPTYQKLNIYSVQLDKLVKAIKDDVDSSDMSPEEVRIIICGDLVHSKNLVTNELNVFASTFLRQLSEIAKVICIAGNHDMVESNTARVDTLSGLFQTAQFENAIFLDMALDYESGVVYDDNITWALYSFFNDFCAPDIDSAKEYAPNNKIIGLFHGMIVGSKLYNGFVSDCGSDCSLFEGCDAVMAGHIHKRQTIKYKNCDVVYAGSPIQQNYGESLTQHGYVIWNIDDLTHEYVDISSDFGYYDYTITGISDIEKDKEIINNF